MAPSGQFIRSAVAGNITMSRYPYDTNITSVRHLIETSATIVHRLGVYYTKIQYLDGRLVIEKYGDLPPVNIFVQHFRLEVASSGDLVAL